MLSLIKLALKKKTPLPAATPQVGEPALVIALMERLFSALVDTHDFRKGIDQSQGWHLRHQDNGALVGLNPKLSATAVLTEQTAVVTLGHYTSWTLSQSVFTEWAEGHGLRTSDWNVMDGVTTCTAPVGPTVNLVFEFLDVKEVDILPGTTMDGCILRMSLASAG